MAGFVGCPVALRPRRNTSSISSYSSTRTVLAPSWLTRSCAASGRTPVSMVQSEVRRDAVALDWENLGFQYLQTRCYVSATYKDGRWSELSVVEEPYVRLHVGATALHYGQACFEGLKAFRCRDGVTRVFRAEDNATRMVASAERLVIPNVPRSLFLDAVHKAVRENAEYIPPYGTGGAMYVRPLLFGSGAKIGLQTSDEYTFLVLVVPVGDYYKGGLSPVTAIIMEDYDRAAPRGVGNVKVAANYAADLLPNIKSKKAGYPINLYLDAQNKRTVEEFGTSNFIGLKGNAYITPNSPSVLPSITNKTLMRLAADRGMDVQIREIDISEVGELEEAGACGTAVVITAVTQILYGSELIQIGPDPKVVGPRLKSLYEEVRGIQFGELPDKYGWCQEVEGA
jgi:branched-chain amino acid aminotransferase